MCHEESQNNKANRATSGADAFDRTANGLGPVAWGPVWVQVPAECGRAFPQERGPVLPAPLVDGGWIDRSVTFEELSAWLRSVLERGGFDVSSINFNLFA